MTEAGFNKLEMNQETTAEQLQSAAGEYPTATAAVQEKYGIPIHVGKTSALRPQDYVADQVLGGMAQEGTGSDYVEFREIAWQVPADGKPIRRPGLPAVRLWESIGPLKSVYRDLEQNQVVRLMALARVVEVKESQVPQNLDLEFPIRTVKPSQGAPDRYSLRDEVAADLKLKDAMEETMQRAQTLTAAIEQVGWERALEDYRRQYSVQEDPNEPAVTKGPMPRLESLYEQKVPSLASLAFLQRQMNAWGLAGSQPPYVLLNGLRTQRLYSLMEPGQETTGQIARPVAFPPAGEVMIARELTRVPATEKDYREARSRMTVQTAWMAGVDLGLIHYNPDNIMKRMDFVRMDIEETTPAEEKQS